MEVEEGRMGVSYAADLHVGTPPGQLSGGPLSNWVIRKVHFHGFAELPTNSGTGVRRVRTPEFSCFGHRWEVIIYPEGLAGLGGEGEPLEGYAAFFLFHKSSESIEACYKVVMKHPTDQSKTICVGDPMSTIGAEGSGENARGKADFAKSEGMLEYLNNGTLTLEIHLRTNKQPESTRFAPSNPFNCNMLKGFNNEEKSDVKFEVGGEVESAPDRCKRAKTTATTFHAIHAILDLNAPALADMCKPGDEAAVSINGVEPDIFRMLLYFCYGGMVSDVELGANAKAIIDAADRFGIVNLKLQAEVVLAEQTEITVDNMLDNLLYANSKNLAHFQEKIMDFVAENGDKIVGNVSFSSVPGELITDILTAFSRGKNFRDEAAPEDGFKFMRVGELRKQLHDKGLCIDGSRETMIALLKENTERGDDEES